MCCTSRIKYPTQTKGRCGENAFLLINDEVRPSLTLWWWNKSYNYYKELSQPELSDVEVYGDEKFPENLL